MSFGVDTWCGDRLVTGRYARGREGLALALYRRTITQRGKLRGGDEESVYGFDVVEFIGQVDEPGALEARVRAEYMKDDRVADVVVTSTRTESPSGAVSYVLSAHVTPEDESESFTLTLAVSDVGVELLGVT